MNICHIVPYFLYGGGYAPAIFPLCKSLRELGCMVEIVATEGNNKVESMDNAVIFPIQAPYAWNYSKKLCQWLKGNLKRFDIVHLHGLWDYPQYIAAKLSREMSIPYIVTPHGIFVESARYGGIKKKLYRSIFANKILNSAEAIHVTSNLEKDGCHAAGLKEKLTKISWGIEPNDFLNLPGLYDADKKWPILKGKRVILFLSRLSPEKGIDLLLPAFKKLVHRFDDLFLVIAGPENIHTDYMNKLHRLVKVFNLEKRLLFTGFVDWNDKLLLFKRASIFVLPSYGENFSFAIAEALACGVPVVTTVMTPWKWIQDEGAGYCVMPNQNAIENALYRLLSLTNLELEAIGRRGQDLIFQNYNWQQVARRFSMVYHLLKEKKEIPIEPDMIPLDSCGKAIFT